MKYILNTFIYIEGYDNCIGILHEFYFKDPEFTLYEHRLINNELFVDSIDLNNKVLYIFKFPDVYLHEYNLFKEGKYSKFGEDVKKLIIEFWAQSYKGNKGAVDFLLKIKGILYKENKLRQIIEKDLGVQLDEEQELGDISEIDNETFKINEYSK